MARFLPYYDTAEVIILVYERIRELRRDMGWTQQQMADLLHINRRTYSTYETGVSSMTPEILTAIAEIHKTSVDYLLGRTDQYQPYPKSKL